MSLLVINEVILSSIDFVWTINIYYICLSKIDSFWRFSELNFFRKLLWDVKHFLYLSDWVYEVNEWSESEFLTDSQETKSRNRRENRLFILCFSSSCRDLLIINDNEMTISSITFHASLRLSIVFSQADSYTANLKKTHSARDRSLANISMWKKYYFHSLIFIAHCFDEFIVLKVSFQANSIFKLTEIFRHFSRLNMIQRSDLTYLTLTCWLCDWLYNHADLS